MGYYRIFVLLLFCSSLVTLGLSLYAFRYRRKPVALAFAGFTLAMTVFSLSSVLSALSPTVELAEFWMNKVRFIGVDYVPVFFLVFVLLFESRYEYVTPGKLLLFFSFPIVDLLLIFSNRFHPLFIRSVTFKQVEGLFYRASWVPGPWFWVHTVYAYTLLLIGFSILGWVVWRRSSPYREQAVLLLAGAILPMFANVVVTLRLNGGAALDFTSFGFTVTGLVYVFALHRYRLLDLVPVARDMVVECIDDAVIVVDLQGRIVDANPAAENFLERPRSEVVGTWLKDYLPVDYDLVGMLQDSEHRQIEIEFRMRDDREAIFDLRVSRLSLRDGAWVGILLVARDVTERVAMVDDRERMIIELEAAKAELMRQVKYDFLTGVYSRRFFLELAEKELVRALRYRRPLSLVMVDIDHFKRVNDTYGHACGDRILVEVAKGIKQELRTVDILARFGGEEFVILLPETDLWQARQVAEKIRAKIAGMSFLAPDNETEIPVTISLGLTALDGKVAGLDDLIRLADQAMYAAKADGRDCLREKIPA
ncbi:MAG: diguanylate cyclase [Deltaproteobacteria bacterium]|nr:diguanylate cyclase [Deltaproteobacteria bacterium]